MRYLIILIVLGLSLSAQAQYPPQGGVSGSTAISKTDKRFVAWASTCTIQRGWMDINDKSQGVVSTGKDADGTGPHDGLPVSLGDSGIAVLTFPAPLYNGPGADFAVFEYSFINPANPEEAFLEFAFVEVSSDGENYFRFPASCHVDTPQVPVAGVYINARKVNNLAGKYAAQYGTPFDLDELQGTPGLDLNKITHVRLVDVIGSIGADGTKDKDGNVINDPYPTAVPSGGFDLDAVGTINIPGWWPTAIQDAQTVSDVSIYPNPASTVFTISFDKQIVNGSLKVSDITGRVITQQTIKSDKTTINISNWANGIYYLILNDGNGNEWTRRVTKY